MGLPSYKYGVLATEYRIILTPCKYPLTDPAEGREAYYDIVTIYFRWVANGLNSIWASGIYPTILPDERIEILEKERTLALRENKIKRAMEKGKYVAKEAQTVMIGENYQEEIDEQIRRMMRKIKLQIINGK